MSERQRERERQTTAVAEATKIITTKCQMLSLLGVVRFLGLLVNAVVIVIEVIVVAGAIEGKYLCSKNT